MFKSWESELDTCVHVVDTMWLAASWVSPAFLSWPSLIDIEPNFLISCFCQRTLSQPWGIKLAELLLWCSLLKWIHLDTLSKELVFFRQYFENPFWALRFPLFTCLSDVITTSVSNSLSTIPSLEQQKGKNGITYYRDRITRRHQGTLISSSSGWIKAHDTQNLGCGRSTWTFLVIKIDFNHMWMVDPTSQLWNIIADRSLVYVLRSF